MGDYIKRTLALDVINHANDCDCFKNYDGYSMTFDMIDEMPRADVQKVKHGKWKYYKNNGIYDTYKCSCCVDGKITITIDSDLSEYKYCPNCGAKMEKE